jgi:hypothetical protein
MPCHLERWPVVGGRIDPEKRLVFTHPAVRVFRVRRFGRFLIFYRRALECIEICAFFTVQDLDLLFAKEGATD